MSTAYEFKHKNCSLQTGANILNWVGFVIFQFALLIIILIIVRRAIKTDFSLLPNSSQLSISQLCSYIYFGDLRPVWKIFLSFSTSFDRSWYFIAGVLIYAIPIIHFIAGTSNLILFYSQSYVVWFNKSITLNISIGTVFVILLSISLFIFREYNVYKKKRANP
jgi:hypothetical protein